MITEYSDICTICGKPKEEMHHLVFGRGLRELADKDGLTMPLCSECHKSIHLNGTASALSKIAGQLLWEKEHPHLGREGFRSKYGRSWL